MNQFAIIENSLEYIEDNIYAPINLDKLAHEFNFSKYYYHRLFTAVMGVSLNNYILSRKLNAAIPLIQNSNKSLTEIGSALYFSTPSAFTRAFKREFSVTPSQLRKQNKLLKTNAIPPIIQRPLKNLNGDIVTDFTINQLHSFKVSGLVFRIDISIDDYLTTINNKYQQLLVALEQSIDTPGYVIYSDCSPDNKVFNVIVGVEGEMSADLPLFFTVDVPEMLVVEFKYRGELYHMDEVLYSDFARFLRITRQEPDQADINMIQAFDNIHDLESQYKLLVPIKGNELDE